jgi:hypothetical protein
LEPHSYWPFGCNIHLLDVDRCSVIKWPVSHSAAHCYRSALHKVWSEPLFRCDACHVVIWSQVCVSVCVKGSMVSLLAQEIRKAFAILWFPKIQWDENILLKRRDWRGNGLVVFLIIVLEFVSTDRGTLKIRSSCSCTSGTDSNLEHPENI